MELESAKVGSVQYSSDDIFQVPEGLFGFEDETEFLLIETENVKPFFWLQSTRTPRLAFLLCDPRLFRKDYKLCIDPEQLRGLEIKNEADTVVFAIVTVPDNPQGMTANLRGPLVFNLKEKWTRQVIDDSNDLQQPIFQA